MCLFPSVMKDYCYTTVLHLVLSIVFITAFTNGATDWAVKVEGGIDQARQIANKSGYILIGKVRQLHDN